MLHDIWGRVHVVEDRVAAPKSLRKSVLSENQIKGRVKVLLPCLLIRLVLVDIKIQHDRPVLKNALVKVIKKLLTNLDLLLL
jgi:hypothetical protein